MEGDHLDRYLRRRRIQLAGAGQDAPPFPVIVPARTRYDWRYPDAREILADECATTAGEEAKTGGGLVKHAAVLLVHVSMHSKANQCL
jgi:hypothetical protein